LKEVYFVNTKKATELSVESASPLHVALAQRITRMIHEEEVAIGSRLNEKRLAELLGVSRTPVRSALGHLAELGFVERRMNHGFELAALPPLPATVTADGDGLQGDALLVQIASDRRAGKLAEHVSETDLMEAYNLSRTAIKNVLARLADVGAVERKLGYRWKFLDSAYDAKVQAEAYRFRLLIEPSALLEPRFSLPEGWAEDMISQHKAFAEARWLKSSSVAFFEMNAAFHEGLAKASGNRFFHEALSRLNRRRRLNNYDWKHGRERVGVSCWEHIMILEALRAGDVGRASILMRQHLDLASRLRDIRAAAAASPALSTDA
jgi:DNA-binding GntR family transcriptional regulator